MAPIEIYGMQLSAPCRIVEMTAEVLGLEYEFKVVDLMAGENMKPEFLALNPQHNIPCVKDGEFVGNESRAVAAYLASKYGKDDSLYPKDLETRYKVDQRLYFDMGVFYKAFGDLVYPVMFGGDKPGQDKVDKLKEVLGWVDGFVAEDKFCAGTSQMTLADIAFMGTYSTLKAAGGVGGVDLSTYTNIESWFAKCAKLIPNYEKANGEGATAFGAFYKSKC